MLIVKGKASEKCFENDRSFILPRISKLHSTSHYKSELNRIIVWRIFHFHENKKKFKDATLASKKCLFLLYLRSTNSRNRKKINKLQLMKDAHTSSVDKKKQKLSLIAMGK
jgi:hypothetical protein